MISNGLDIGLVIVLGQVAGEGIGSLGGDQEDRSLQGGQAREDQVEEDERIGIEAVPPVGDHPARQKGEGDQDERP